MFQCLIIGRMVFQESIRDRLFYGLMGFLGLFLVFSASISGLSLGTPARYIENSGMAGLSLASFFVVILFGIHSLYQEKERNDLYVILNHAPRHVYILGRFLGVALVLAVVSGLFGGAIFFLTWLFGETIAVQLFWAVYWNILEFSLLTGIGFLFYATGISFTLNALLILLVFIIGHSLTEATQSFIALGQFGSPFHLSFIKTVSYLVPNFDLFDFRLDIIHNRPLAPLKIILNTCYWFFYLLTLLICSNMLISRKDL